MYDSIVKHYILCDQVHNQSDHCPIVLEKQWNRACGDDNSIYRNELANCLKYIQVPIEVINCNNM